MSISTPARLARLALLAIAIHAIPAGAQRGSGDGFLFRAPRVSLTVHGAYAQPSASGGVFQLATENLTLGRGDFGAMGFGADLAVRLTDRADLVLGFQRNTSLAGSEYRDWVDNNDQPIEQSTRLERTPLMASLRYHFGSRGRSIGSVAWVPANFVPFVSAGVGVTNYRFEQQGDFVDEQTLDVFSDRLISNGWTASFQGGVGAQWSVTPRVGLTGEVRYLHGRGNGGDPFGDFSGYKVDLSGVSTLVGLTLRL